MFGWDKVEVKHNDHYNTLDTIGLTNGTIGTTNGTIGTNVSTNGNIGTNGTIGCRKTFRVLWLPMVPLATNGTIGKISNGTIGSTIGKISNGTIGRIPNARYILVNSYSIRSIRTHFTMSTKRPK